MRQLEQGKGRMVEFHLTYCSEMHRDRCWMAGGECGVPGKQTEYREH